ncbi:MAG TPA: hypothetical protein VMJ11_27865, partial [Paraburkholderia sp.]|uniref:hypothetical protein n=1 Tax=Paraburkholderia sp. TaxID=1926495 RepID=UPI002C55BF85
IAIPPFNGFPSEWLIVQGLLRSVEVGNIEIRGAFAVAGALVALTAGLAVTAFVKGKRRFQHTVWRLASN